MDSIARKRRGKLPSASPASLSYLSYARYDGTMSPPARAIVCQDDSQRIHHGGEPMAISTPLPKLMGQPVRRREDPRLITGSSQYVDDIQLPGMLHMIIVRSPYGHARVNGIDTAAALKTPGVVAVYTAKDLEGATTGPLPYEFGFEPFQNVKNMERGPLATDKVRYVGDPVAVVLAETRYGARDGAAAVEVDYEPLPA